VDGFALSMRAQARCERGLQERAWTDAASAEMADVGVCAAAVTRARAEAELSKEVRDSGSGSECGWACNSICVIQV
jgi:hypothetical protein